MTSTRHSLVDISDLPADTPPGVKSFISTVRLGYSTIKGTFEGWKRAIRRIAKHAPVIHFTTAVAVGALMRPLLRDMPGGILYLQGTSTTGKSIALRTALSLRADPSDMTWGFDSMATLKWYTVAAEHNFLCLDDIHMAILPDNDSGRPVSSAYLLGFDHWEQSPHTTILATGIPNLRALAGKHLEQAVEVDAQQLPLWPTPAGMSSADFSTVMLEKAGIVVPPGTAYGPHGEGFVRIALSVDKARLAEAFDRMAKHSITYDMAKSTV